MGDWIKNNKFEALLLLVVILVGLGAYVYGSGKGRAYTEAKASFDEHAQSVTRLKGKKPFPDQAKAAAFEAIERKALTSADAPSKTSGHQKWKGTADSLKASPTMIINPPSPSTISS